MTSLLPSFDSTLFDTPAIVPGQVSTPPLSQETPTTESRFTFPLPENASNDFTLQVPTVRVWGIDFAQVTMEQTLDQLDQMIDRGGCGQVITANLNYVMLHQQDPKIQELTRRAAMVLCDGMPILWRSKTQSSSLPARVAGSDLIYRLCERASQKMYRVFFLGAAPGVAQQAADKLAARYPGLQVAGVECPPFRPLSDEEERAMVERIRSSHADILLVAFGQPKGELWLDRHFQQLGTPVCIQLGASFDFVAGTAKRAPTLFQRTGLEWFYRMCTDPKRLIPRYSSNLFFLLKRLRKDILEATQE